MYELIFKVNENSLNIEKMGVLSSSFIDIKRSIFGFDAEIEHVEELPVSTEYGYNVLDLNFKNTNKQISSYADYICRGLINIKQICYT